MAAIDLFKRFRCTITALRFAIWDGQGLASAAPRISSGSGVPTASDPKGSVYFRTGGASANEVAYVATDSAGSWTALTNNATITDSGTYYTTDTVDGAFDALALQIGGDTDATYNFTGGTGSLVTDDDAVYAALNKLDQGFVSLKSTANAKGASLVGIEDSAGLITATNAESAFAELAKYIPIALADPGTGVAIPVTRSASIAITTAAAETNTLAIPTFIGQKLILTCDVYAVGDRVVTASVKVNQTGNNTLTFGAAGDTCVLEAVQEGGTLRWQVTSNDGVGLTTV